MFEKFLVEKKMLLAYMLLGTEWTFSYRCRAHCTSHFILISIALHLEIFVDFVLRLNEQNHITPTCSLKTFMSPHLQQESVISVCCSVGFVLLNLR